MLSSTFTTCDNVLWFISILLIWTAVLDQKCDFWILLLRACHPQSQHVDKSCDLSQPWYFGPLFMTQKCDLQFWGDFFHEPTWSHCKQLCWQLATKSFRKPINIQSMFNTWWLLNMFSYGGLNWRIIVLFNLNSRDFLGLPNTNAAPLRVKRL